MENYTNAKVATAAELESEATKMAEDGYMKRAYELFVKATSFTPDNARLYEAQAQCLLELDDAGAACIAAARATELCPSWPTARVTLGRALLNAGHLQDSLESFTFAMQLCASNTIGRTSVDLNAASEIATELQEVRGFLENHWLEHHDFVLPLPQCLQSLRIRQFVECSYCRLTGEQGPGGAVWGAGVALAQFIHSNFQNCLRLGPWPDLKVLELGSGTGVAGLAAASLGANVMLTDREPLLQVMDLNIGLNAELLARAGGHAGCTAFDWMGQPPPSVTQVCWDLVLCADLVYSYASVMPFVNAVAAVVLPAEISRSAAVLSESTEGASQGLPVPAHNRKSVVTIYAHNPRSPELDAEMHAALLQRGLQTRSLPLPPLVAAGRIGLPTLQRIVLMEIHATSVSSTSH